MKLRLYTVKTFSLSVAFNLCRGRAFRTDSTWLGLNETRVIYVAWDVKSLTLSLVIAAQILDDENSKMKLAGEILKQNHGLIN